MIKKIKRLMFIAATLLTLAGPSLVPSLAFASTDAGCNSHIGNKVAEGANDAAGSTSGSSNAINCGSTSGGDAIAKLAAKVVNIFSIVVGAAAVIMIIYAGFRYITSGGSSERVGGAKNSLIYAIIGLVIVAIAQLIVHYVLNTANTLGT